MKYIVKHSCGHEREVALLGSTRERERKLEWMATIPCPECREKEEAQARKEKAEELGLPDLQGTEKQVAWAEKIRLTQLSLLEMLETKTQEGIESRILQIERAEKALAELEGEKKAEKAAKVERSKRALEERKGDLTKIVETIAGVIAITEASWWIDHRDNSTDELIKAFETKKLEEAIEADTVSSMATMEPEEKKTSTVCTVTATAKLISIKSDKDDLVRTTVKKNGFTWDGGRTAWVKVITELTGPAEDLQPDTCRILLSAGIPVRASQFVREAVEAGTYRRQCHRWIRMADKEGFLAINVVDAVKSYPGQKTWNGDFSLVRPNQWKEIREFAELNGYRITQKAEAALAKAEVETVKVHLPDGTEENTQDGLKAILESSRDILEDLKEDE